MQQRHTGYYGDIATKLITAINALSSRDKANMLSKIIQNKGFITKLKDNKTKTTTKIYRNIKATNVEYNDNMNAARTLNRLGYDVFMLPKLSYSKSPDFILQKGKMLYIYELKTIYGESSLENRLNTGSLQSDRIILNIVGQASSRYVASTIKNFYLRNKHIKEIKVLLGGKPIDIYRNQIERKNFIKMFMDGWAR
jgi:hypothetical protein